MANPAGSDGVPPWTVENYVLHNRRGGWKYPEIAHLEHINGNEPYCQLWTQAHNNQNAYIESFNGRLRDECLNEHWFTSLAHARAVIEAWRREYNDERPKRVLGGLTPTEYTLRLTDQKVVTMPGKL
jgi:putative transposase